MGNSAKFITSTVFFCFSWQASLIIVCNEKMSLNYSYFLVSMYISQIDTTDNYFHYLCWHFVLTFID